MLQASIDVTKVYTELTEVQIAYEAALKVTVEGMNLSMFSYI